MRSDVSNSRWHSRGWFGRPSVKLVLQLSLGFGEDGADVVVRVGIGMSFVIGSHAALRTNTQSLVSAGSVQFSQFQTCSVQSGLVELTAVLSWYLVVFLQLQGLADPLEPPLVGQLRPLSPQCLLQLLLTHLDSDKVEVC